jgi:hypothetical protein
LHRNVSADELLPVVGASNCSSLISTFLIAGAEPIAAKKRIEDSNRASILNSVAAIARIKVTPGQLISDRDRMLAMNAPGERGVCAYDIV